MFTVQNVKDENRNIEIAFEINEMVYGEFIKACGLSRERPVCVIERLLQRFIISSALVEVYRGGFEDMCFEDNIELQCAQKCEIIEKIFGNQTLINPNEWIESIE